MEHPGREGEDRNRREGEGGREGERSQALLLGSREGKHDSSQRGCFHQDFVLIAICVISAWPFDQSFG